MSKTEQFENELVKGGGVVETKSHSFPPKNLKIWKKITKNVKRIQKILQKSPLTSPKHHYCGLMVALVQLCS